MICIERRYSVKKNQEEGVGDKHRNVALSDLFAYTRGRPCRWKRSHWCSLKILSNVCVRHTRSNKSYQRYRESAFWPRSLSRRSTWHLQHVFELAPFLPQLHRLLCNEAPSLQMASWS